MEIVLIWILFLSLETIWNFPDFLCCYCPLVDRAFSIVGVLYLHWLWYLLLRQVSMWAGTHIFILELQSGNSRKLSMWYDGTICFVELCDFRLQTLILLAISDMFFLLISCSMLSVLMIIHPLLFRFATTVTWGFSPAESSSIRSLSHLLLSFVSSQLHDFHLLHFFFVPYLWIADFPR